VEPERFFDEPARVLDERLLSVGRELVRAGAVAVERSRRLPSRFSAPINAIERKLNGSFMERMSENVASGMGTVQFVLIGSLVILAWC
jgi:uncharacterized membrane protein